MEVHSSHAIPAAASQALGHRSSDAGVEEEKEGPNHSLAGRFANNSCWVRSARWAIL